MENIEFLLWQAKRIAELETKNIMLERLSSKPLPLGLTVFCVIGKTVVEGYVLAYEDVFNIHTKTITRVIKISLHSMDGILSKSLSEVGKTIFSIRQKAIESIK